MDNLQHTKNIVRYLLTIDTQTRNSDYLLYLRVLDIVARQKNINLNTLTVPAFLLSIDELGLPPFETVRRSRQNLQEKNPELAASEGTKIARARKQRKIKAFVAGK